MGNYLQEALLLLSHRNARSPSAQFWNSQADSVNIYLHTQVYLSLPCSPLNGLPIMLVDNRVRSNTWVGFGPPHMSWATFHHFAPLSIMAPLFHFQVIFSFICLGTLVVMSMFVISINSVQYSSPWRDENKSFLLMYLDYIGPRGAQGGYLWYFDIS